MDSQSLFALLADYEKKSVDHAVDLPEQVESVDIWSGIGFRLGDHYLVAELGTVLEVIRMPVVTRVPGAKSWMYGVANIRGNLVSVVDLRMFFHGERTHLSKRSRVLIVEQENGLTGLLVDEVFGLRHFEGDDRLPEESESPNEALSGFLRDRYQREDQVWISFDLVALVEHADFLDGAA